MSEESEEPAETIPEFPAFMRDIPDEHLAWQMQDAPEYYINRAYFSGNDMDTLERMLLFQAAADIIQAQERAESAASTDKNKRTRKRPRAIFDLKEWDLEVKNSYPKEALPGAKDTKTANPDAPPRAAYLYELLKQLLLLVDAPDAMIRDLKTLLGEVAHAAAKRAAVQAAMIAHPDWSETKIAKHCAFDQSRMVNEIESGKLCDFRELRRKRTRADKP